MLDSQLIAPPAGKVKGPIFPLGVDIDQYIPSQFPLSVGTLLSSKAHTLHKPRIHSDHYCVGALLIIARTKAHALSVHTQWYPGLHKIYSYKMQYTEIASTFLPYFVRFLKENTTFFPTKMFFKFRNGPLLHVACHWWHYKLWIHRIFFFLYNAREWQVSNTPFLTLPPEC